MKLKSLTWKFWKCKTKIFRYRDIIVPHCFKIRYHKQQQYVEQMFMPMQIFKVYSRQQHNTYIISEKWNVSLIYFSSHNRNRAVFVTDAVAIVAVVKSTLICGCGFAVVRFYAVKPRLRLFDPSLVYIVSITCIWKIIIIIIS